MHDNILEIGESVFNSCMKLTSVHLPSNLKTIGEDAFFNCKQLVDFELPDGLETIGIHAFRTIISERDYVDIPSSVTSIGSLAFGNNTWKNFNIHCQTPPAIASDTFDSRVISIHIPTGTMNAYLADSVWATLSNKLVADL